MAELSSIADHHSKFPTNNTVVWSPLFQATWDEMNTYMGGNPNKASPKNELMSRLDQFKWNPNEVLPEDRWQTWAGPATDDFLTKVNQEAAKITGEESGPFVLNNPHPANVAAFGLLDRMVEFEEAFFRSKKRPLLFGKEQKPVHFFGVMGEESDDFRQSVRVLAYRPIDGSHALEVSCKGVDDKLIIYRPSKPINFATACKWIKAWRKAQKKNVGKHGSWNDSFLHEDDHVEIPYITLTKTSDFSDQLKSDRFYGKPLDPYQIRRAEMMTRFKLTEKGAEARVDVSIELDPFGGSPKPPTPRKFIYDRPFFVFLWREKSDWPYLGVWVGDTSTLKKFE